MSFTGVQSADINAVWAKVSPLIHRAIQAYSEHDLSEVYDDLINRRMQLWVGGKRDIDAILITKLADGCCYVELCGGRGMENLSNLKIVEEWATQAGCKKIKITGRKGWQRVLKDYRVSKVELEKEIGR